MLAAIRREPVDHVPTDIWCVPEVWETLGAHLGCDEPEAIKERLHIDGIPGVRPEYVGPELFKGPNGEVGDYFDVRARPVTFKEGTYKEIYYAPLAEAKTIDDLEAYRWPDPDWFDYGSIVEQAGEVHTTHLVNCGGMDIFTAHNKLRGMEASLMDPLLDPEFTRHLLKRIADFQSEHNKRMFEAGDGCIDMTWVADDLGMQTGPLISLEIFREFYRPHMQRYIDLAKEFGLIVFHHDDGAIRPFLPDLVEMGIDILNPLQRKCPGMELEGMAEDFGDKLIFHGGIENQHILPFGTPEEVRAEVRYNLDTLARDGTGYILAPCHNLQAITPVENILALYDEARTYGRC